MITGQCTAQFALRYTGHLECVPIQDSGRYHMFLKVFRSHYVGTEPQCSQFVPERQLRSVEGDRLVNLSARDRQLLDLALQDSVKVLDKGSLREGSVL